MNSKNTILEKEQKIIEYVQDIKGFYSHLFNYAIVVSILLIFNFVVYPDYIWAKWAAFGWGIGIISHGLSVFEVFNFFGPNWERKQIEKKLGNKL